MPIRPRERLTIEQRAKRLGALVVCGLLGLLSGLTHAGPFVQSRQLAEEVARRSALTVGIRWTVLGLVVGMILARILQSARLIEVFISVALIVLLWEMCMGSTHVEVR